MCLSIPGEVVSVDANAEPLTGKIRFGAVARDVCLTLTPDAKPGDYVIVHAGFAISILDEAQASELFDYLSQMDELTEDKAPASAPGTSTP